MIIVDLSDADAEIVVPGNLGAFGSQRQVNPKGASGAFLAVKSDAATHPLDHLLGYRKADAHALDRSRGFHVQAVERFEDTIKLLPGNSDAGVGDGNAKIFFLSS